MKNLKWLLLLAFVVSIRVFADDIVPPVEVPTWLDAVIRFITGVPVVGPFLLEALKWVGIVAAIFTAITTLFMSLAKAFEKLAFGVGFYEFANKIKAFYDKVYPWLAYLSVYNVPKKKD